MEIIYCPNRWTNIQYHVNHYVSNILSPFSHSIQIRHVNKRKSLFLKYTITSLRLLSKDLLETTSVEIKGETSKFLHYLIYKWPVFKILQINVMNQLFTNRLIGIMQSTCNFWEVSFHVFMILYIEYYTMTNINANQ